MAGVARGMSSLGTVVTVTALLLDLHERGAGSGVVAGVLFAGTLPIVLLAPVIGLLIDRYDSRGLIVVTGVWQAASCVLIAFVTQPLAVLSLVALNAFGAAVAQPVIGALIKEMVTDDRMAAANSVQQSGHVLALLGGPAIGALLTGLTGGARVPLLIAAVAFLAISVSGLLIRTRRRPDNADGKLRLRDGITVLFADRAVAASVILSILLVIVVHILFVAQVYLVRDTFGASEFVFGLLQTVETAGLLIGVVVASRMTTVRRIMIAIPLGSGVLGVGILLVGVLQSLPATFVLYLLIGAGSSVLSVSVGTLLLLRTPDAVIGRALATFTALHRSAGLLAYGFAGLTLGLFPPELVFILSGACALLMVLAATPALRRATTAVPPPRD
jgi:MFS family permease